MSNPSIQQTTSTQPGMTDSAPSEVMGGSSFPSTLTASQSTSTLQEGNIASSKRTLFVAVGDGYSGYYAVEESIRMKLFERVVVSVIAPEAVGVLQNLGPEKVVARTVEITDPSSIADAAAGCDIAYLVPPARDDKVEIARMMIDGVRRAGINNCVVLSSIGADATDKPSLSKFRDIEEIFKNAGFTSSCILRGGFYSQNLLLYVDQLNEGVLKLPIGDGKMSPVDIQDMSGAAMRVCADIEKHNARVYSLIGDELVDGNRLAEAASKILNKPIRFQPIGRDEAESIVEGKKGLDASEGNYLLEFYDLVREGKQEMVSEDVRKLLDQTPTNVEGFLHKHLIDITVPSRAELKSSGA